MSKTAAVVNRFPERELEIHRLCSREPEFGAVCEDYGDALGALRHWQTQGPAGAARALEYHQFLQELEAEILAFLDRSRGCRPHPDDA